MTVLPRHLTAPEPGWAHSTDVVPSGGLTLDKAAAVAATGVDYISVGALTHSAPILDIALDLRDR